MNIVCTKNWNQDEKGEWWYSSPSWKAKGFKTRGQLYECAYCHHYSPKIPARKRAKNGERYCSTSCASKALGGHRNKRGSLSHFWKGGRNKIRDGYIEIYAPEHPFARGKKYIREHRLIMEKHLGRYLQPWEQIHHKNGIKDDNRIENLELVMYYSHNGEIECPNCHSKFKVK